MLSESFNQRDPVEEEDPRRPPGPSRFSGEDDLENDALDASGSVGDAGGDDGPEVVVLEGRRVCWYEE